MTVNVAEDRHREAVSATEESNVCVCGRREKAGVREREGGGVHNRRKIGNG